MESPITQRFDQFVSTLHPELSRSKIQQLIKNGHVWLDGKPETTPSRKVVVSSVIELKQPTEATSLSAEAIRLEIIFEDDSILVINKPTGHVVHPNSFEESGSIVQAALAHYPALEDIVYEPTNPVSRMRPGIVHRLDKDTSGVLVIAKTLPALHNLAKQFQEHTTKKIYKSIVFGELAEIANVDAALHRQGTSAVNKMVASLTKPGWAAQSVFTPIQTWEPLKDQGNVTEVSIEIMSGRTHQIRAHAKFIGHPVMGDTIYHSKTSKHLGDLLKLEHQVLHAQVLTFNHPETGERLTFTAEAHFPITLTGNRTKSATVAGQPD